ncbi:hypothetical protein Bca52824_059793 [Brassica carinata]|uniref:Uncharacterized protein n=1 Tax=Brassica carinata TaxID=52824 RepID=A0A8X7QV14_BRACI|nr:hypothetical protein Bca52824_059793 [Brassica carinata]
MIEDVSYNGSDQVLVADELRTGAVTCLTYCGIVTAAVTIWRMPCEMLQSPLLKMSCDEDETQLFPLGLETDSVTSRRVSLEHLAHMIATVRD